MALHFIELVIDSHWIILFCRKFLAANGAIMRTAILGVLKFNGESWCFSDSDTYVCVAMGVLVACCSSCSLRVLTLSAPHIADLDTVIKNTREICLVTHTDPRCVASTVAATTAVSPSMSARVCAVLVRCVVLHV